MVLNIYCDGGARGNPGPAAAAFVVRDSAGHLREKRGEYLSEMTNNMAEYGAVIAALEWLREQGRGLGEYEGDRVTKVEFFLDSNLIVNQLNGLFKVREARLREMLLRVRGLEQVLSPVSLSYSYVPREQNFEADKLVNETLDQATG